MASDNLPAYCVKHGKQVRPSNPTSQYKPDGALIEIQPENDNENQRKDRVDW